MARTKAQQAERDQAVQYLLNDYGLTPGTQLYTVLRHRSRSGMMRVIDLIHVMPPELVSPGYGPLRNIGFLAAKVVGMRYDREREGVVVGGAGMDMGFHLVYELSSVLFPAGFGVLSTPDGKGRQVRPASPEEAAQYVSAGVKFFGRNGDTSGWDYSGGYALQHTWL